MEAEASRAVEEAEALPPTKKLRVTQPEEEDDDMDVFNFGGDLGPAAYTHVAGHGVEEEEKSSEQDGTGPERAVPAATAARLEASTPASEPQGSAWVVASLCGIEDRLAARGERPCFREAAPGRLEHQCTTAAASVAFWPGSLQWEVSGADAAEIEDFITGDASASSSEKLLTG